MYNGIEKNKVKHIRIMNYSLPIRNTLENYVWCWMSLRIIESMNLSVYLQLFSFFYFKSVCFSRKWEKIYTMDKKKWKYIYWIKEMKNKKVWRKVKGSTSLRDTKLPLWMFHLQIDRLLFYRWRCRDAYFPFAFENVASCAAMTYGIFKNPRRTPAGRNNFSEFSSSTPFPENKWHGDSRFVT